MAATDIGTCHSHGLAMMTQSNSSLFNIFSNSRSLPVYTFGASTLNLAMCFNVRVDRPCWISQIATILFPGIANTLLMCSWQREPVPINPKRSLPSSFPAVFLLRFWRTCYCCGRSSTCHSQTCCTNSGGSHFF